MSKKDLTKDQIKDIIHMKAEGHSIAEIMQKYPFIKTRSTIYYHLYKAPAEKQNSLTLLHKKLDQVMQKVQNIEQYLSLESMQPEQGQKYVMEAQDSVSYNIQDSVQDSKTSTGEIYLKTSEILKLCFFSADGKTPDISLIQKIFKQADLVSDDPRKKGYLLRDIIKVLQERNIKTKGSKLDISKLIKLQKDAKR